MGLRIANAYSSTVWTTIMFYSPETCGGPDNQPFECMGWWRIEPGTNALVYANDVGDLNPWWYVYAQASDGAVWSGPFQQSVPRWAFGGSDICFGLGIGGSSDYLLAGYHEFNVGDSDNYTLTLTP